MLVKNHTELDLPMNEPYYVHRMDIPRSSAMSASARLVVQMTPSEKTALAKKAKNAGLTASEFVRRRISEDENPQNAQTEAELEAVLTAFEKAAPDMIARLDKTITLTEQTIARIEAIGNKDTLPV